MPCATLHYIYHILYYVKHIIAFYLKNNLIKSISNMENMSDRISGILEEEGYESELEHCVGLGGELERED